jgi:hypothetical protein
MPGYSPKWSSLLCVYRWYNHLDPSINRDPWTPQEDATLMQAHRNFGNKWADIAKLLPGRLVLHLHPVLISVQAQCSKALDSHFMSFVTEF